MDQVSFFLAQHATESGWLLLALIVILLLATLHRMRRMRKQIRKITGNTDRILTGLEQMTAKLQSEMLLEAGLETARIAEEKKSNGKSCMEAGRKAKQGEAQSATAEPSHMPEQDAGELQATVGQTGGKPEELIDAVLEEVFL